MLEGAHDRLRHFEFELERTRWESAAIGREISRLVLFLNHTAKVTAFAMRRREYCFAGPPIAPPVICSTVCFIARHHSDGVRPCLTRVTRGRS